MFHPYLLHQIHRNAVQQRPDQIALRRGGISLSYRDLDAQIQSFSQSLLQAGTQKGDRICIFLKKSEQCVISVFGASQAGLVSVPMNPSLKADQAIHILLDCQPSFLVTSRSHLTSILGHSWQHLPFLKTIVLVDGTDSGSAVQGIRSWKDFLSPKPLPVSFPVLCEHDLAALFYTSGSTSKPKGVMISHRNLVAGAQSVASYLGNRSDDKILALLPFSFDAGFSQITTSFLVGATLILHDFLLAADILRIIDTYEITGITAVPPIWIPLGCIKSSLESGKTLRYFANTGGKMPKATLKALMERWPQAQPYLMYGLTEAFRSTYLPPREVHQRPDSIGKAIPNVEILVLNEDGAPCQPGEVGELVHRGPLVAAGYWRDPEQTLLRFRPLPPHITAHGQKEIAVFSGDLVRKDEDGFLYFCGRKDGLIKTSGYRINAEEVEDVIYQSGMVDEVVILGVDHESLGQELVAVAYAKHPVKLKDEIMRFCIQKLPSYMVPRDIYYVTDRLPRNPNGKIDRLLVKKELLSVIRPVQDPD